MFDFIMGCGIIGYKRGVINTYKEVFEGAFNSDEEVESAMDSLIMLVGEIAAIDDNRDAVIIPEKIKQVAYVYKLMRYIANDNDNVSVMYKLNEPFRSMGSVSVVGRDMSIRKPEWLIKAISLSSNFEVYPKTDGTIKMDFTFHGLTRAI